jgi:acetyl-CoA acyltransferase
MPSSKDNVVAGGRRAVVIGGVRTPFVKAFGDFLKLDSIDLGVAAVRGLLERFPVPRAELSGLVWGGVILPGMAPNVGREITLDLQLPGSLEAMTVTRACTSGLQAITLAAAAIERGEADLMIAGGSDSTSNAEVKLPQKLVHAAAPMLMGKGGPESVLSFASQLWPLGEVLPRMPRIAERTTGKTMGESAEEMARRNEISREAQDELAMRSHQRAARATETGRFAAETVPVDVGGKRVSVDNLIRGDTSLEKLAKLRPAFAGKSGKHGGGAEVAGTITAGNASPLTDGGAAVLLASEDKARALGLTPLAAFSSWSYVGVDPADQLLIGPAMAIPLALDRAGLTLADMDYVDMHEAFAAQVLSVTKVLASDNFARARLGRPHAVGSVDPERFNIHGGSIALGHPFAATGARMVTTMANELHQSGKRHALLGICAAGGLGAAAVLERV